MKDHIRQTIQTLEQELEAARQQFLEIERALVPLRRLAGDTRNTKLGRPKKAARRTDGRTDGRSKARANTWSLPSAPEPP